MVAGWTTTEVGRQPWTVYGVMRTAQSVTPSLTGADVLVSLIGYVAVYSIMFPAGALDGGAHRAASGVVAAHACARSKAAAPPPRSSRCLAIRDGRRVMILDFVPIWTLILGLAVFFYVLLDGFDLGVGILYALSPSGARTATC